MKGDLKSRRASRKNPCHIPSHGDYGAVCLACAMALAHEEADWTREQCARIAEKIGHVGKLIAKMIRDGRPHEYEIPNRKQA